MFISAHVTASASVQVGYDVKGEKTFTLEKKTSEGWGLGLSIHIRESKFPECDTIKDGITIKGPTGDDIVISPDCASVQGGHEISNDPPLRTLGSFCGLGSVDCPIGEYDITSTADLWIMDVGEEIGEAVGGIFAAMGMMILVIIFFITASILCCVACCCMEKGQALNQGNVTVVGKAVSDKE